MESTLKQIGYMALSWCLRGFLQSVMRPIMIPKLVRMGKMHPEVARQNKPSWRAVAYWLVLTAAVAAFLAHSGVVRMTVFLVFTTLVLPLFRAVVFPASSPSSPSSSPCATRCGAGRASRSSSSASSSSRPSPPPKSFSSMARRQARQHPRVSRVGRRRRRCLPRRPHLRPRLPRPRSARAHRREPHRAAAGAVLGARGVVLRPPWLATADGENPYRVLGVPQTASETQIRK